jgi:hypothetical protein
VLSLPFLIFFLVQIVLVFLCAFIRFLTHLIVYTLQPNPIFTIIKEELQYKEDQIYAYSITTRLV